MSESRQELGYLPIIPETTSRGRRWAEDETVPAVWIFAGHALRKKHGLPRINLMLEADKFVNHWISTGKPMKSWKRTWLNWCVNARGVPEQEPATPVFTHADNDRKLIELALKGVRTMSFGPDLVRRAREKGICTEEEARRLGY